MSIATLFLKPLTASMKRLPSFRLEKTSFIRLSHFSGKALKRFTLFSAASAIILLATVNIDIKGHFEGIFLLHGRADWRLELKDYLYVGDGERLIVAFDWDDPRYRLFRWADGQTTPPYVYYEWDSREGSGFIRNILGNGRETFTSFGRFMDDNGKYVHGLFVGGTLPTNIIGNDNAAMNESGMAYRDEGRWYHVWCNVNEGLISPYTKATIPPSEWVFLGSRIINGGKKGIVLTSSHQADVDGVPLRIDRYVYLRAGEPYFLLTVRITNVGSVPAHFYYVYGDEPWVGNYGSSRGNVGWVADRIIHNETVIDSRKYSFAGMFDFGNDAIDEGHNFTGIANFIQWFGKDPPEVYFANDGDGISDSHKAAPLTSNTRFIGLQWGPRQLLPGQITSYVMAIGIAATDKATGFPRKPEIRIDPTVARMLPGEASPVNFTRNALR